MHFQSTKCFKQMASTLSCTTDTTTLSLNRLKKGNYCTAPPPPPSPLLLLLLFFSFTTPVLVRAFTNKYKCLWLASLQHRCMFVARGGLFINFQPWKVQRAMNVRVQIAHTDKWTHRLLMYHCKAAASTSFGRKKKEKREGLLPKAGLWANTHT